MGFDRLVYVCNTSCSDAICFALFCFVFRSPFFFCLRTRTSQVSTDMSSEGADMDKLSKEMDRLQNAIEAANGWELDRVLERAMDALRCPDGDALVANLSG